MTFIVQPIGLKDFSVLFRNIFNFVEIICGLWLVKCTLVKILFMFEIFFLYLHISKQDFSSQGVHFFYFDKKIMAYTRGHSSITVLVYILSNRSSL